METTNTENTTPTQNTTGAMNTAPVTKKTTPPVDQDNDCLLYTSPSPRDQRGSRMPSSA